MSFRFGNSIFGPLFNQKYIDNIQGAYQPERLPSQLIRPVYGTLLWLVDQAAASLLSFKGKIQ